MRLIEFDPPDRFVAGTVGPPGQRTFFLQASEGRRLTSVSLEKQQVSVLADRINDLLDSYAGESGGDHAAAEVVDNAPLDTPIEDEFRVDRLSLAWDDGARWSSSRRSTADTRRPDEDEAPTTRRSSARSRDSGAGRADARRGRGPSPGAPSRSSRRPPAVPVLRRPARARGAHLPAVQRLQALTDGQPTVGRGDPRARRRGADPRRPRGARRSDASNLALLCEVGGVTRRRRHRCAGD